MSAGNDREFIDFLQSKEKGGRPMFCPLFTAASIIRQGKGDETIDQCEESKCAWWSKHSGTCSVFSIGKQLEILDSSLHRLIDKMPKWEQFGK